MPQATLYRMVLPDHECPFGRRAKDMLDEAGFDVEEHILGSREEVDAFGAAGAAAGGTLSKPVEENEWGMYGGQLTDPDGHIIDFFHMEGPPA